ncbi:MAG: Gfo/Idh/MocA family oxidoreductase [Pseudomonadota bacterium]
MQETISVAIAGFGLVGRRHAKAIAQVPGVDLWGVIEPEETARHAASALGLRVCESLDACFAIGGADAFILATPNDVHAHQALACIDHGRPVLVEKPLATRSSDAEPVVVAGECRGVPVLVGHHRRYNPLIERAKAVIAAGRIGTVRAVQATCWLYKPDAYFDAADWRKAPGAGPVAVNLVHDVDLIRFLCGEVSAVQAVAHPSARGYANEDVSAALLELADGAICTISVSDSIVAPWSWELTAREHPVYPPTSESCYLIGGSEGGLSIPDLRLWHYGEGARDWWAPISATTLMRETTDPLVRQIAHFAAVIRGEAAPVVSGREGLQTLRVIEAIQASARTGARLSMRPEPERAASAPSENV